MKKTLLYFIFFFVSKSTVFLAPLLLTEFMTNIEYGKVEYALGGLGFLINTVLGFGIPASYGYFILKKSDMSTKSGYSLYILILAVYFIVIQGLFFVVPEHIYLSLVISFILANQVFYSYVFKAHEQGIYATLLDSGIYFVILIIILGNQFLGTSVKLNDFILPLLIYSSVYIFIGIRQSKNIILSEALIQLKKITTYSSHLLLGAFLIILLINSGRFILEFFPNDFENIAIFGFYLRISGISLVIFQMLFILYFKKIYTKDINVLDKVFSIFLILMMIYSVISLFVLPPVLMHFSGFFAESYSANSKVFCVLTFFTFFWTGYNLFSNIIVREGLAKNYNYYLAVVLILFALILVSIPDMNIELFVIVQLVIGVIIVILQQLLLYTKGYIFRKSSFVLGTAILIGLIFCISF